MKKYYWTFIFLYAAFSTNAQVKYADSLLTAGYTQVAAVEYERVLFETQDPEVRNEAILKKAFCYKLLGQYNEAYQNLLRANLFDENDSINDRLRYESVLTAFMASKYNDSYNQYVQFKYYSKDTALVDQAKVIAVLALNEQQKWGLASELVSELNESYSLKLDTAELFAVSKRPKIRNLKKQQLATTFFPGYVLVREGQVTSGLLSFTLKSGIVFSTFYHIIDKLYFTALLSGGMYNVFYAGSTEHAIESIKVNNQKKITRFNEKVSNSLFKALETSNFLLF
ncbi:hypothetical protein FNH22_17680 [Fulvivirga sp. M361]|uniref:hypothetical protein n=1 Tax=Fulvivirga sp. M361 TaxID=2594266 RepID=UPI00117ADC74|nr:hypothetical protein [Fulvivirga sp. M361]TRX55992.1 hypothetical protein FNH22_17680 [Fulvivirga sp. M361]